MRYRLLVMGKLVLRWTGIFSGKSEALFARVPYACTHKPRIIAKDRPIAGVRTQIMKAHGTSGLDAHTNAVVRDLSKSNKRQPWHHCNDGMDI